MGSRRRDMAAVYNNSKPTLGLIVALVFFFIPSVSSAQDFTANTIGNYGTVTVMEVTGNYDANSSDSALPRQEIAKEFFTTHPDDYDFLVIFSNFDFQMPEYYIAGEKVVAAGFYSPVKNDVQGIGQEIFDHAPLYGSDGKLQGTIDMGFTSNVVSDPLDPGFERTMTVLSHEILHRWAAYAKFKKDDGTISSELLGSKDVEGQRACHWSFLLDTAGSVLYGNQWQDNGSGTFTALEGRKYYSPLDLYLMGLIDKSEVPPMLLIENPDINPERLPEPGVTIEGSRRYVTIDDIIAAEGERIPSAAESQKTFKLAFILITRPDTFTGDELYGLQNIIKGWGMWFSSLTDGKGIVKVDASPLEDLPANPGVAPPPYEPRTVQPEINHGVAWLMEHQHTDGSWMDVSQTGERDTAEAVLALKHFPDAAQSCSAGAQWLSSTDPASTDYLCRKIEALVTSGDDATILVNNVLSRQNPDGGWGSAALYRSNPTDTSFALKALAAAGYSDESVIKPAIDYIKAQKNTDGGWGSEDQGSTIQTTVNVLTAFTYYRETYQLDQEIESTIQWLITKQNPDGGFGNSPSTVYDTAIALLMLQEFNVSSDITSNALNYILGLQSEDGSWYASPYQTALAVSAVWKGTIDPDLSVSTGDISFTPSTVTSLPTDIVVNAVIRNKGLTDVPEAKVAIYDGAVSEANKVGEQTLAFPGKSSVTATFTVTVTDGETHRYYVAVDPENLVKESSESNNTAIKPLYSETTYDFEILSSDISVSPNPIDILQNVTITARVTNKGTRNGYNFPIKCSIDAAGGPFDIATIYVDIPAGSTIDHEVIWKADKSGENLLITVEADPANTFAELSETNNTASTLLTVNPSTEPNLTLSYQDIEITPSPAHETGSATISAIVKNEGFSAATDVVVNFYKGVPDVDGILLGSQSLSLLAEGESANVVFDWINIMEAGERVIYIQVDPDNLVQEIREDDNSAFTTLQILSLPDLAVSTNSLSFDPAVPKDGDTVSIQVTIQNGGEQDAANVLVKAYEGSTVIGSGTIALIPGNSQGALSFTYDTTGKSGTHEITIVVDPDNTIVEQSKDNNTASRSFGVQDANLWLSEPYISPNGDSIKDSTEFSFRLETPQTVHIVVVNSKGEVVRTFGGSEFENTTGGIVVWDGLDDNGMVVADGQYHIEVRDTNNTVLASLLITVDNNRSLLTDAIGTEYLLHNNTTCMLPNVWDWQWFPDESGIIFHIDYRWASEALSEYPTGLYTMASNGGDIFRLVPWEWCRWNDPTYDYYYKGFSLSPDGAHVAFILQRYNKITKKNEASQLWIVDRYGKNRLLLDSYNLLQERIFIKEICWAPDNTHIAYTTHNTATGHYELWVIKPDGTEKTKIDSEDNKNLYYFQWSPDSKKMAVAYYYWDEQKTYFKVINILDNKEELLEIDGDLFGIEWLNTSKIFLIVAPTYGDNNSIWLIDISGDRPSTKIVEGPQGFRLQFAISPNHEKFAFTDKSGDIWSVKVCDDEGNSQVLHESPAVSEWFESIRDLRWSHDGTKLAFIDDTYKETAECYYEAFLIVIDVASMEKKAFKVSDAQDACGQVPYTYQVWTQEGDTWVERGALHYDSLYETKDLDLTTWFKDSDSPYHVRITQQGMDAAHIDYVALSVNGKQYQPVKAVNVLTGEDILPKVIAGDHDVADVHGATVDFIWDTVPNAGRITLVMNAREEDLSARTAVPFRYPEANYYSVKLDQSLPIKLDGKITPEDRLPEPLFTEYTRPVTGHPEGFSYGYVKSDGTYLYGVLDFTSDNTLDDGRDWASIEIATATGIKTFLVNDSQKAYGETSLTYTDKVNYEHKVYEFRVPLSELGISVGDTVNIAFKAYGTAGGSGGSVYYRGELQWLADDTFLVAGDTEGIFVLDSRNGDKTYLPIDAYSVDLSPLGRYMTYYRSVELNSICYGRGSKDLWTLRSALNLTADLSATGLESVTMLKGTAADLNFAGYTLEYADTKNPDTWNLITPSSDIPVMNDVFTSWIPPSEGTFYVRLTVFDKAGNVAWDRKVVSWGRSFSIVSLYTTENLFSPNGDGVKDAIALHYRVLEPLHLEVYVYDEENNLVRTYLRDYAIAGSDAITWDGRDEYGQVVPDGTYKIMVFDHEFFVEVDNTPPDVLLELSPICTKTETTPGALSMSTFGASLLGRVSDTHLKKWVIEYGEGENPNEWYPYDRGDLSIGKMDVHGNIVPDTIKSFIRWDTEFIVGKKFRITTHDHAGNRSTSMTDFLEEVVIIYSWEIPEEIQRLTGCPGSYPIELERDEEGGLVAINPVPPKYAEPGPHSLYGFETIRAPLVSVSVQFRSHDGQWQDAPLVMNPPSGGIYLEWDSSGLEPRDYPFVRIKAVDATGKTHYSNEVFIDEPPTPLDKECPPRLWAHIEYNIQANRWVVHFPTFCPEEEPSATEGITEQSFPDELKLLTFEVQSEEDIRYSDWTVFSAYDVTQGDIPVATTFEVLPFPDLLKQTLYWLRATLTTVNGVTYVTEPGSYIRPDCGVPFTLGFPITEETSCGSLASGEVMLLAAQPVLEDAILQTLSYYIQKSGEFELIDDIDLTTERWEGEISLEFSGIFTPPVAEIEFTKHRWGGVAVDTTTMDEGTYPVKIVLEYFADNAMQTRETLSELVVDRTLPEAEITFPRGGVQICSTKIEDPQGDWYGIYVEGSATDDNEVRQYDLYYGVGWNPSRWFPAQTRINGMLRKISGEQPVQGLIGIWDVSNLEGTLFSLQLRVMDLTGNLSCYTTNFSIDTLVKAAIAPDKRVFSPNGDGYIDDVNITYTINEYATADVKVVKDSIPVRTLVSGLEYLGGTETIVWDGKNDSGIVVPDGLYEIVTSATGPCGNVGEGRAFVEVDNTPPTTSITYPQTSDTLGIVVEVKGTAQDLHFKNYVLEFGAGANPATWILVASESTPRQEDILGVWNTHGLEGPWTVRLTATDTVGNSSEARVTVDFKERPNLIKHLEAAPQLFSPNNDGALDTTEIRYELVEDCDVSIEIFEGGTLRKTYTGTALTSGLHSYHWDGSDTEGTIVSDGTYAVILIATLASNTAVTQQETVHVIVDTTSPLIDMEQPLDQAYFKDSVTIKGSITDQNITEYSITGDFDTAPIDEGTQNRENHTFATLTDLLDGDYVLTIIAKDRGENISQETIGFTLDRAPPKLTLLTPIEGEIYGSEKNVIKITGTIEEENLETWALRYGAGDDPAQWTELVTGTDIPATQDLFTWSVGKDDGIPDGRYTLMLYAKDKAGWESETRLGTTIDNTPPLVAITSPINGGYVKEALNIEGTAFDANLDAYTVEVSEGECGTAFKWTPIKTAHTSIQSGVLAPWQVLPPDGNYCLKVTATDKVANTAETTVSVIVDTHPPAPPVLSGEVEDKINANLTWTQNIEPDLAGYNLYRDGTKINTDLITATAYLDTNLSEGIYTYTVKAVDRAGWESDPSNEVKLRIDITGPNAQIRSPQDSGVVSDLVDIKGTAYSADDFKQYRIYIGQGADPSGWTLIRTSPVPIAYGSLAPWDTIGLADNQYSIKLEAEDISGNVSTRRIVVSIDNAPPAPPVLLTAVPTGSDVDLTWQANTEPDIAGYLLYRNDQLVNVSGTVVGDLAPYLIPGTTYNDPGLPDGTFSYYLIAMDEAGNTSAQSNTLEVTIDTHPPQAHIVAPDDGHRFETTLMVKAESFDLDIVRVQFQYKKAAESTWQDLGNAVATQPYVTHLDPVALGLIYGDYNLRAVATDQGGRTDSAPSMITVIYTDVTPPAPPKDLKALTNGADVTLTWQANTESDLAGYNLHRVFGDTRTKVNDQIIQETTYAHQGLSDDVYTYEVTALDTYGNESAPSNTAVATVYAPMIAQPNTPTPDNIIEINGSNAAANATVEIFVETSAGAASQGTIPADAYGAFIFNATLSSGENRITARAIDSAGNISRTSDMVVVVYNEAPAAPTGLAASVVDYSVTLTWDPNTEPDLAGYNIYRDGEKVNESAAVTSGTTSASSYSYNAYQAFDNNTGTYWRSPYGYPAFNPCWWEVEFSSAELINRIEIEWGGGTSTFYAGKDYEIQVWSGYAWITQVTVTGNDAKVNTFDFSPSYRTNKIRIAITDTTDPGSWKRVQLTEVRIFKDALITAPTYEDAGLDDGEFHYTVTAIDEYGFESAPSNTATAPVGDVVPPAAPLNLTATADGSDIICTWAASPEPDLAGYNLYKKTDQGWTMVNGFVLTNTTFTDATLPNGTYTYRVTALDTADNESEPSNEASATVAVALPGEPINLTVTPVPEGNALTICWEYTGDTVAGFNLYRSTEPGGSYVKVNNELITDTCYLDTGLTNGVTYYYKVVAVDMPGNESAGSNEGFSIPADIVAPAAPVIFFPTKGGTSLQLDTDTTAIKGSAEPTSTVELFKDGESLGTTTALAEDSTQTAFIDNDLYDAAISFDGETLAYTLDDGSLWIQDRATQGTTKIDERVYLLQWSPDGTYLAYVFRDEYWYDRIRIYNVSTQSAAMLTDDTFVGESFPSWSADGAAIAFVSSRGGYWDVWAKDLVTGSLTRLTQGVYTNYAELSPDGTKLAYVAGYQTLYVLDLATNDTTEVDTQIRGTQSLNWSSDSAQLAFVSARNGSPDLFVYDILTGVVTQLTDTTDYEVWPVWSPEADHIVYAVNGTTNDEVWVTALNEADETRLLYKVDRYSLDYLTWAAAGDIYSAAEGTLYTSSVKGLFSFADVRLDPGENLFHATATDAAGNVSPQSDAITLIIDPDIVPDPATSEHDIFIYPPAPLVGEETILSVVVWNYGAVAAENVDVDVYVYDATGYMERVISETIPYMGPGSGDVVTVVWDTIGKTGANTVMAFVDYNNTIHEASEENNSAVKDFFVAGEEGITMTTALDAGEYNSNDNVNITVDLHNSGREKDVELEVRIEDEGGVLVAVVDTITTSLAYAGDETVRRVWNTGVTYAGSYAVHSILKDTTGVIEENTVLFTILPDFSIDASVITDKTHYGPDEDVLINAEVANNASNSYIAALDVRLKVTQNSVDDLFIEDTGIVNLFNGTPATVNSHWNTGLTPSGEYHAEIAVYLNGAKVAESAATFTIDATVQITGDVTAAPAVVFIGDNVTINYTLTNSGNAAASALPVTALIIDPDTREAISTHEAVIDLGVQETFTGQFSASTRNYGMKTYHVVLQGMEQGVLKTIASTSFIVKDGISPVIAIISPTPGATYRGPIDLVVTAHDNASGVDRVDYRIDDGDWRPLPAADPSAGRYATTWEPVGADEGTHTLYFRATDRAGNTSPEAPVSIVIELLSAFDRLTGTISAAPDPVYFGLDETFLYSLVNESSEAINNLTVRVNIVDPATDQVVATLTATTTVSENSTTGDTLTLSTATLAPQVYKATFEVAIQEAPEPRILDTTTFEVLPSIELTTATVDHANLLVWVNHKCGTAEACDPECDDTACEDGEDCCCTECIRTDLLEAILDEAATSYHIVYENHEFEQELQNPYYTDIVILGNQHPITDHYDAVLKEKINAGTGIIAALWMDNGEEESPFGINYTGGLSDPSPMIETVESPISEEGLFGAIGKALRVEAQDGTTVAGTVITDKGEEHPAIVLNDYGRGRAVYYAFDLGLTLNDDTYEQIAALITNSISYVHRTEEPTASAPYRFIPIELTIKSLGGSLDVQITETFPEELRIYCPVLGEWIESPWGFTMHLEPDEVATIALYVFAPDALGTYAMETEIGFLIGGEYTFFDKQSIEVAVGDNTTTRMTNALAALDALSLTGREKAKAENAVKYLEAVQERDTTTEENRQKNIQDLLKAIESITVVTSVDITDIRLMIDELLRIEEARYYFFVPIEEG